jgi:plastocyanin
MNSIRMTVMLVAILIMPLVARAENAVVEINHQELRPAEVSVQKGETVTFINRVDMPGGHSVVAEDGSFTSPQLDKNQSWSHSFDKAGTFAYHIQEHPGAKGVIEVK